MKLSTCFLLLLISPQIVFAQTPRPIPDTTPYFEKNYDVKPDNFKPLSKTTGYLLAFSPINGDGLIYTGHYVSAGLTLGMEFIGVIAMIAGGPSYFKGPVDENDLDNNYSAFANFDYGIGQILFFSGLTLFGISYAIDAIATPLLVSKHNRNLKKAEVTHIAPYLSATDKQWGAGVNITF